MNWVAIPTRSKNLSKHDALYPFFSKIAPQNLLLQLEHMYRICELVLSPSPRTPRFRADEEVAACGRDSGSLPANKGKLVVSKARQVARRRRPRPRPAEASVQGIAVPIESS